MRRNHATILLAICLFGLSSFGVWPETGSSGRFRPPAIPLVVHDPYFSIWSISDRLTDDDTKHWTGKPHTLAAMIRVDDQPFRIMGRDPESVPPAGQVQLDVSPTRTLYRFSAAGVELTLTFLNPLLPSDLELLSRPVTYVIAKARSTDGKSHRVRFYLDAGADIVVNTPDQPATGSRFEVENLHVLAFGSQEQRVLEKSGDDLRIDWGYLYLAAERGPQLESCLTDADAARLGFARHGRLPAADDLRQPRRAKDGNPVAAMAIDLGEVAEASVSRRLMLAYDDRFSIEYFYRRLRPYWRRLGWEARDLLLAADREYDAVASRCGEFDAELSRDLAAVGGEPYVRLGALAFRQAIAAHKLAVDIDGTPLFFPKENFSNGCISTVDVIYPESPMFLLFNPALIRALLTPVLEYAAGPNWHFPFAPHDLGTYPLANGQVYGGGSRTEENQMPVEESGNMLLMLAALARAEGNADFSVKYWKLLRQWADYLLEKGFDPENQLCTDDFAGHLAHNTNLSIKAILALQAYSRLCQMTGKTAEAEKFRKAAQRFAGEWTRRADDGDHFRLAFDRPGTWSQKYNLIWDRVLDFHLFPIDVSRKEMRFYLTRQLACGLPLDNRKTWTKLDWILWTATLAESRGDFDSLMAPVSVFLNRTPERVPLTDWYWADSGKQVGFQARPVVGGVFIKMLADPSLWKKWSGRAPKMKTP